MKLTLQELKDKHLPHCECNDVFKISLGVDGKQENLSKAIADINQYLSVFAKPTMDDKGIAFCLCCGEPLNGLLGSFEYGIAHGEGSCAVCGWPARANHYDFGVISAFRGILQYHPDEVNDKKVSQ